MTCADALERQGRYQAALDDVDAAVKVFVEALRGQRRPDLFTRWFLAQAHGTRARLLDHLRRGKEATAALLAADEGFSALRKENPTATTFARDWAANLFTYANLCRRSGDLKAAETALADSLGERERLYHKDPRNSQYAFEVADSYREAATLAKAKGKPEEAPAWNGKAVAVLRDWLEADPRSTEAASKLAAVAGSNAQTLTQLGRHAESLEYWDLCLKHGGAPDPVLIRLYRAAARGIAGDRRGAEQGVAEATAGGPPEEGHLLFALACAQAALAEAAAKDDSLTAERRADGKQTRTKAALAALTAAKKTGNPGNEWEVRQWKTARALDSLRGLPEFQAMAPK
jgi:hypothetical protein